MKMNWLLLGALITLSLAALVGCSKNSDYIGTWYEQNDNGGVLTVDSSTLTFSREGAYAFTESAQYKPKHKGGETLLKVDENELLKTQKSEIYSG